MKRTLTIIAAVAILASCVGGIQDTAPSDRLISGLKASVEEGKILFGHQDAYMYGHLFWVWIWVESNS